MAHVPCDMKYGYSGGSLEATIAFHNGAPEFVDAVDIQGINDTNVALFACVNGTMIRDTTMIPSFGENLMWIHGDDGYYYLYGHCEASFIKDGERVKEGERIGTMGTRGNSTGIHLHFMVLTSQHYPAPNSDIKGVNSLVYKFMSNKNIGKNTDSSNANLPTHKQPPAKEPEPAWESGDNLDLIPYAIGAKSGNTIKFWKSVESKVSVSDNEVNLAVDTDSYGEHITGFEVFNRYHKVIIDKHLDSPITIPTGRPITIKVKVNLDKLSEWSLLNKNSNKILTLMKDKSWGQLDKYLGRLGDMSLSGSDGWQVNGQELSTTHKDLMDAGKPIKHNNYLKTDNTNPKGTKSIKYTPELWSKFITVDSSGKGTISGDNYSAGITNSEMQIWEAMKHLGFTPSIIYALAKNAFYESTFNSNIINTSPNTFTDDKYDFHKFPNNQAFGLFQFYKANDAGVAVDFFNEMGYDAKKINDATNQIKYVLKILASDQRYSNLNKAIQDELKNKTSSWTVALNICKLWVEEFEVPASGDALVQEANRRCDGRTDYFNKIKSWYK